MKPLVKTHCLGIALGVVLAYAALHASAAFAQSARPTTPAAAFFTEADIQGAKLSPSGDAIAVLLKGKGDYNVLAVQALKPGASPVAVASLNDADVLSFYWAGNERLVFDIDSMDKETGRLYSSHGLFSVKRDGTEMHQLVRVRGGEEEVQAESRRNRLRLPYNHDLLHIPLNKPDEVIVGEWVVGSDRDLRVVLPKRLNLRTGYSEPLLNKPPPRAVAWWFDRRGQPTLVATRGEGGRYQVLQAVPKPEGDPEWRELLDSPYLRSPWYPLTVDAKGQLWVSARGQVTAANPQGVSTLRRFDAATGQPESKAVLSTPGFDFSGGVIFDEATGEAKGVRVNADAEATVWLTPGMQALQAKVDERLPGLVNRITCRRCEQPDGTLLVFSYSDRNPGRYHVQQGPTGALQPVGDARKAINPEHMAAVDFQRIRARDGADLPVWLTLPAGLEAGAKPAQALPTVVLVHGGPWVRGGHWRWRGMAQFLASRGYLVVEPEFRGSSGYGSQHLEAGFKQWGQRMQDDVADATRWAVQQGLADAKRVCIAGGSYGGYATLMGLVNNGDMYRCGAAYVAVTDLQLLFKASWRSDVSDEARRYSMPVMVGDPVLDADMLKRQSPVHRASEIKAPVFLAFGEKDLRVPLEHGTAMRAALRAAGNEPEWVVYEREGHGWAQARNRVDFAQRLEAFFGKHLK
jgi:acetyl esterase/lipase